MTLTLLLLFYILAPAIILFLCQKFPAINRVGAVVIAYLFGLVVGNSGILPSVGPFLNEYLLMNPGAGVEDVKKMSDDGLITAKELQAYQIYQLRDTLMSVTILLAIPLILFSVRLKQWKLMAGKTLLSLVIGLFSVVSVIFAGYFLFAGQEDENMWKVSGMLVGVYTGGTPNLASLKLMLGVDANTYILTHTYDLIIGVVYLAFLMTVGQRLFLRFLVAYPIRNKGFQAGNISAVESYEGMFSRSNFIPLMKTYCAALIILGISVSVSLLVAPDAKMIAIILSITSLGITGSLIPAINRTEKTFESGMYLILIFSLVVSSMAHISSFAGIAHGLFFYISFAVFGSLLMHVALARLFRIDADTVIITSTAMICSPPFVPVVAGALKNREIVVPGLTIGIVGYAVGNYLGFLVANLLKGL
jgi:uncharacterized membrane protein